MPQDPLVIGMYFDETTDKWRAKVTVPDYMPVYTEWCDSKEAAETAYKQLLTSFSLDKADRAPQEGVYFDKIANKWRGRLKLFGRVLVYTDWHESQEAAQEAYRLAQEALGAEIAFGRLDRLPPLCL